MSRLAELMRELCPDGVEYKKLSEVFNTRNGYTPSKSKPEYWKNGVIPWFRMEDIRANGNILDDAIQKVSSAAVKDKPFPAYSFIVATSATIGEHALITVPSLSNQRFTYLMLKQEYKDTFDVFFLNYYFCKLDKWCLEHLNQGNFASVDMRKFGEFEVPVPPLDVQREIVRVLDHFTSLTAELTAELTARKKQYEYYRDELLALGNDVEEVFFGDVLDTVTDYVAAGSFADIAKNVQYLSEPSFAQLVRTVDIKSGFQKTDPVYVNENAFNFLWRVNLNTECIIMPNIGVNCGEIYYLTPSMLPYEHNVLGPNAIMVKSSSANNKFLAYLFQCPDFQNKLRKIISPCGQTKFNKTELKKIKFLLPSRDIQERIVQILDIFNNLCNDLSTGLPAEIEARTKQYEYYRDKLLSFKRKETA